MAHYDAIHKTGMTTSSEEVRGHGSDLLWQECNTLRPQVASYVRTSVTLITTATRTWTRGMITCRLA